MFLIERSVLSEGLVQPVVGEIEISEHPVAVRIVWKIFLCLLENVLGLVELVLRQIQAGEGAPRLGIFRRALNGLPELPLGFGKTTAQLIEIAQRHERIGGLRIQGDSLPVARLGCVPLLPLGLQQSHVQI